MSGITDGHLSPPPYPLVLKIIAFHPGQQARKVPEFHVCKHRARHLFVYSLSLRPRAQTSELPLILLESIWDLREESWASGNFRLRAPEF